MISCLSLKGINPSWISGITEARLALIVSARSTPKWNWPWMFCSIVSIYDSKDMPTSLSSIHGAQDGGHGNLSPCWYFTSHVKLNYRCKASIIQVEDLMAFYIVIDFYNTYVQGNVMSYQHIFFNVIYYMAHKLLLCFSLTMYYFYWHICSHIVVIWIIVVNMACYETNSWYNYEVKVQYIIKCPNGV